MAGSQDFAIDPRNETALIWLNGALTPRAEARVSVFDAGFVLGDGVWEGLRLHKGALLFLDAHLDRLFAGARAIGLDFGMTRGQVVEALEVVLAANGMTDGVHLRLMVTRGEKAAANQDPRNWLGRPTVVIVAEWKTPSPAIVTRGLSLATVSIRCTPAHMFDMRLNSHSRLNLILALREAIAAGADEALMLDPSGLVASCNATNFFWVREGEVRTSSGEFCFNGVTRANVIALCREHGVPLQVGDFAVEDARAADEAFVTGTFAGVVPVREVDGRIIGHPLDPRTEWPGPGPMVRRISALYRELCAREAGAVSRP